ncbi:MAG: DUF6760 family protein [Planctomycetota bacterium]
MRALRPRVQSKHGHDPFFGTGVGEEGLQEEVFFLAYHLHWSWSEVMALTSGDRRRYVDLLVKQIERENAQIEAAGKR